MKRGNACHRDLSGVMGNSQKIGMHDLIVYCGDYEFVFPPSCFKADGTLKKHIAAKLKAAKEIIAA